MDGTPLTSNDWLDLALSELKAHGYTALKAQPLARKLNVTRGSFYYHFKSLSAFHASVISHWSHMTTGQIVRGVEDIADPRDALNSLLQKTLSSGEELERAIRSWSTVAPDVAKAVERVDQERIKVAKTLLVRGGLPEATAVSRAKLLYWAAIGRLMLPFPENNVLSSQDIANLAKLMFCQDETSATAV